MKPIDRVSNTLTSLFSIDRTIPPHMRMSALLERLWYLLETDWKPAAKLQMMKNTAEKESFPENAF